MNENMDRVLELGLGFMIFIIAISIFFRMDGKTTDYMKVADAHLQFNRHIVVSSDVTEHIEISKGTLYFILTDVDHKGKNQKMGDEFYFIDNSGALDIRIDGRQFPIATDYVGIQSLRTALDHLGSYRYTPEIMVDDQDKIIGITYTSY